MKHPFIQQAINAVKLGKPKPLWFETITEHFPPIVYENKSSIKTSKNSPYPHYSQNGFMNSKSSPSYNENYNQIMKEYSTQENTNDSSMQYLKSKVDNKYTHNMPKAKVNSEMKSLSIKDIPDLIFPEDMLRESLTKTYPFEIYQTRTLEETPFPSVKLNTETILKEKINFNEKDEKNIMNESEEDILNSLQEEYTSKQKSLEIETILAREQALYMDLVPSQHMVDPDTNARYKEREDEILNTMREMKFQLKKEKEQTENSLSSNKI